MTDIETLAKDAAGNWKNFESFGWSGRPDDADDWTIVYTDNRDSGVLDQSNSDAIETILEAGERGDVTLLSTGD